MNDVAWTVRKVAVSDSVLEVVKKWPGLVGDSEKILR